MGRKKSTHPSLAHYHKGCRCVDCKKFRSENDKKYRSNRGKPKPPLQHGEYGYYTKLKCRCVLCRNANNTYKRNYVALQKMINL